MTDSVPSQSEPRIVLFAPAARLEDIAGALAGIAAIVVAGSETGVPDVIRGAGIPVLKAARAAERAEGFDGLHLSADAGAVKAARKVLPPKAMLGAGAARTRHAAMQLGEAMPDYVLLGRIATDDPTDRDMSAEPELVSWWADLFELPCVAVAQMPEDAGELAAAGADFIAVNRLVWDAADPGAMIAGLAAALAASPARAQAETAP